MPIVEFYSSDTHTIYQFYARNLADSRLVPRCPGGEGLRMERALSTFAVTGRARGETVAEPDSISPEKQAAMLRLSSRMEGLNEDNPDPRQLGRMLRDMSELMGKEVNRERMDEAIRRLEAGEDPDRMEDHLDSLLGGEGEDAIETGDLEASRLRRTRRAAPPHRDPTLYEMREYV